MQFDSRSDVATVPEIVSVSVVLILVINWKLVRSNPIYSRLKIL
jgi:hypothetical protein